jgi:uncharacterized Rmd1/YagE family protein
MFSSANRILAKNMRSVPPRNSTFLVDMMYRSLSSYNNNNSNNDDRLPPHKHIIPPLKSPPVRTRTTIVEPPIRSRPFRPFSRKHLPRHRAKKTVVAPRNSSTPSRDNLYASYPVQAVQIAQQIDLAAAVSKVFATKGVRRMMERLSVVVQLPNDDDDEATTNAAVRFVAVFRFGSIVFFNVSPRDMSELIQKVKTVSIDPVLSGSELKEHFCVHVQPPQSSYSSSASSSSSDHHQQQQQQQQQHDEIFVDKVVSGDYCIVQELNMKSVDVISNVMAQSIALDSYNDTVDDLLANFEKINGKVTSSGNLSTIDRDKMFRIVARNNSIFIEMVSRVGIKDRMDTAWNLSQYEDIHDGMREEFDIDQRFEHIEFKLNLIQQNAKFFLEVLANQKSNSLEWIIIVLIMFECVLMCMEMSGAGSVVFGALGDKFLK